MLRKPTRRRRRSRSASPVRVSKRVKSRSRDRRGRDVVSSRGMERAAEPMRREKGGRNRDLDRRMMVRGRDGDMDNRRLAHPSGPNSLAVPGGSMRGGRERERDVHVRELPPSAASDYRGGGDMRSGPVRGVTVHHMAPFNGGGGGRVDAGRGPPADFRAPPPLDFRADVGNGYGRGGYLGPAGRSGDRERERDREMQQRDREKARDRDRETKEKERTLMRGREERARTREARAAADLRAAEAMRRDTVRMRDEAMLHARGANGGGGGGGGGGPPPLDAPGGDRPPRMRTRERGRERGAGRGTRGQYMTKTEVDALFTKVIKIMAEDKSRFPCTASLINDRMKKESVADYNVANSEYARFSNVLQCFEADGIVGTTKSRDSIQVVWTKYSPAGSGSTLDTRRADSRRTDARGGRDEDRSKIRMKNTGRHLQLYFCAADEVTGGAVDGDAEDAVIAGVGGEGANGVPYADIIALLQGRAEVLTSMGGNPAKETLEPKAADDASGKDGAEKTTAVDTGKTAVQPEAEAEVEAPPAEEVLSRASTEADEDNGKTGGDVAAAAAAAAAPAENSGDGTEAGGEQNGAEKEKAGEDDEEGIVSPAEGKNGADAAAASNGKSDENGVLAVKEEKVDASGGDVYARDMAWLRSAHGLVAEVSTPSLGVGYKIAMMAHQRCKPCLCLMYKGQEGDTKATTPLSAVLKGDRNLDLQEYRESSEIGAIVDAWIDKRFPRRRSDSRGRGGRDRGRDRGRDDEGPGRRGSKGKGGADDGVKDMEVSEADGVSGGRRGDGDEDEDVDKNSVEDDNVDDNQSNAEGGGGGGAESLVSNDEHEEVEDATGDTGNVSADADDGQGALEDDGGNDMVDDTAGYGSAAEEGKTLQNDDGGADGKGEDGAAGSEGSGGWISSEEEKISNDGA